MSTRVTPGDIVRIAFDEKLHSYGQILVEPYVAVYDRPTAEEVTDMNEVIGPPILFIVAVHQPALKRDWPVVGKTPQGVALPAVPEYFMQDIVNSQRCRIIDAAGDTRWVEPWECVGLERAAVWATEHVTERLRDHYAGRPNAFLESMKLRLNR